MLRNVLLFNVLVECFNAAGLEISATRERYTQFCLHISRVRLQDKVNLAKSTFDLKLFLFTPHSDLDFYFDFVNVNWLKAVKEKSLNTV